MPTNYKKTAIGEHKLQPESLMMGYGYDPKLSEGAIKCPNFQTSTFVFESAEQGKHLFDVSSGRIQLEEGEKAGLVYSRFNNPTIEIAENRIAIWDNAQDCIVTGSGMSAISTTLLALSKPGDVIVYSEPIYGGTDTLINGMLTQMNIKAVGFISSEGTKGLEEALKTASEMGNISVVMLETPDNPTNNLVDLIKCRHLIDEISEKQLVRPILAVDNTMLGPLWQQPLKHGADLCLYSLTKYVGGHSDLIGGSCSGNKDLIAKIRKIRNCIGTTMDSHTAWLILRSLETLKIRMQASAIGAKQVVDYLNTHKQVTRIDYPGLLTEGDPQYQIYKKQCTGAGSTFSFEIKGGEKSAFNVLNKLKLVKLAVSLGGTESLAQHPAAMTHSGVPKARRELIGVTDGLIRISIGIEEPADIIADLAQAMSEL
ncbi:cystathionine gamma-synthase family protein [Colwellia sp. 4_MG-2023]|uniref:cystathionine gamma-synthase family protein n=1 Tax=unclassified Colwellia TaxID=196834 RepID=UPI0026E19942|nr:MULTISPECIES: cystathionine gamma-synthase family protein [unclassified Colwellia]MDO6505362.1 cystathionine gamma-synthase family protein [Colwellia sp. 5_MG-2023]MDO6554342.1 cystathionine gamma-synthase family protein [Colwellia sp. 4_MG-2023]